MNHNHVYADLHLHSNRSDGACSPKELVDKAVSRGLKAIAIVDHDEVSALDEAIPYGQERGLEVIPGVELSVSYQQFDLHMLAYCFDSNNPQLASYLNLFQKERVKRAQRMVEILAKFGMPISFDTVLQKAGPGSIGRPHIADVLVEEGHVFSIQEAFDKYIGNGKPAYVAKYKIDVDTTLRLVTSAGGVCSIAHPGIDVNDEILAMLIKVGLPAIETIHPKHNEHQTRHFSEMAKRNGLLETGGSDYHGGNRGDGVLGKYKVPYEVVDKLKEMAAHAN
jgi:predicted metal-dependent phosphoesterase TrpH